MYEEYFGFRERPFQLLPNPAYLFLSKSHEEALAHLLYAVSHGEGFVEISGEVGTGKTTLCRSLLESLGEEVVAAYVFHPKMDPVGLLQTITGEFGIPSGADNTRELLDILNHFLMTQKENRKKVILIIDEAQNLTKDVLEQVRLLSNLETTTSKLLQIVLVGQPELVDLLDSHEMRQLRQRVNLRCRLTPMSFNETRAYIRFRIEKASREPAGNLLTRSALARIYAYSKGIPRLINISADRALLTAYGADSRQVTGAIAGEAIAELTREEPRRRFLGRTRKAMAVLLVASLILLLYALYSTDNQTRIRVAYAPDGRQEDSTVLPSAEMPPQTVPTAREEPAFSPGPTRGGLKPSRTPVEELQNFLLVSDRYASRAAALVIAMGLWNPGKDFEPRLLHESDDETFFRLNAHPGGLSVTPVSGVLALLRMLNLPAVLVLASPEDEQPRYLTLSDISGETFRLRGIGESGYVDMSAPDLDGFWPGNAYILWKNFLGFDGLIPLNSPPESVIALKLLLTDMGFRGIDTSPDYDFVTRQAVRTVQETTGIYGDGVVGPLTAIALYNSAGKFHMPHLVEDSDETVPPAHQPPRESH